MRAHERLLAYVRVDTTSDEFAGKTPSTPGQLELAGQLADEMRSLSFEGVRVTDDGFVYGFLPATKGLEHLPCLGLIAHMDTAPDFAGKDVRPQVHERYDGGDVRLAGSGDVLSPAQFPTLARLAGKTLITTDGTTLLGADDKAGIAEILTACEQIVQSGAPHCRLAVAFTPDEEIGSGIERFDVEGFGADFAYTVDGGDPGELGFENFNACGAQFDVQGVSVHPGSAKDTMVNASLVAMQINAMLPAGETPRDTEGREGFFHLTDMQGDVERARLRYIVREHDAARFEARKEQLRHIEQLINHRYGAGTAKLTIREQYRNMIEQIRPHMHLVENAHEAMREAGMEPRDVPVRGGTDGARLCYMGLPCPNLCTGGYAFHGRFEHIAVEDMDACVRMLVALVARYSR